MKSTRNWRNSPRQTALIKTLGVFDWVSTNDLVEIFRSNNPSIWQALVGLESRGIVQSRLRQHGLTKLRWWRLLDNQRAIHTDGDHFTNGAAGDDAAM